jgi:predicted MFS family arabinose efflux permease
MNFGLSAPILVGAFMLLIGFVLFLIYIFMDKDFDRNKRIVSLEANDESFRFRDFVKVLQNPGFWMIAILCVFFYSSIRPFMKFATDLLINKYGVEGVTAGWIVSALPYATIILTPLFGSIYDRIGKGATLMLIGCVLVTACHICLLLPFVTYTWFATVIMIILGIAFSLVPSAMWPSVPKIVPLKQLGTAYSIIYYIQNLGLMLVPMWVGDVIGQNTTSDGHVDFTMPMMIFVGFGIVAIFISSILLIMDKKKHYGLEDANIIK